MKTEYKYIHFEQVGSDRQQKSIWDCFNNKNNYVPIARVHWYYGWKQYVAEFAPSVYSQDCLLDIADFIQQLNKEE